mgnify:FL=1|jgi:hypothetical protein|tara:strand:- start:221 stop:463 length:243 start_codon:yes stop_codon:yes gene_type:complete
MKLLLENWRKLLEGNVLQFPPDRARPEPKLSKEDLYKFSMFEDGFVTDIDELLTDSGGTTEEIEELIAQLLKAIKKTLKK